MEEIRTEGSQQASNLLSFNTEQLEKLSNRDKADQSRYSVVPASDRFSFDRVTICALVGDEEDDEGDPFSPTGSEVMEKPNNVEPRERRVSDVIDSIGDYLPDTDDHRIPLTDVRGPDSPVSLGYGSVDSGTPKSSVSPESDANPSSPSALSKKPQADVTDAFVMNQDEIVHSSGTCEAVMSVEKDAEEYNMNHKRRGKAVIFNHDEFKNKTSRPGSAVDVKILEETYEALGFEVVTHKNLKFTDIQSVITDLAIENHSDADCLLMTVLTHGESSKFLYAHDSLYNVEDLWSPFTANNCPTLAGKPKVFIIQACRGQKLDPGVNLRWGAERRTETDSIHASYKIPSHADFLIAYSSVEGYYSWRHPDKGTWFIQSLCKELQEHASTKDFLKILTRTSRRVAIDHESYNDVVPWQHQQKQVPSFNSMLIRDLYFKPKI